jgi:radical SAM superfamily enzyme YgiQ (UPF0313 family)
MTRRQILLVGPWDRSSPRPGQYAAPPLGVHRLAGYCRLRSEFEVDVDVIDPALTGTRAFVRSLRARSPALVGISTLAPTLQADLQLVELTRRFAPASLVVLGGQGVAGLESLLVEEGGADLVVRGFGEEALVTLAGLLGPVGRRGILADSRLSDIPNLTIRESEGKSCQTRPALVPANLFRLANEAIDFASIPYPLYWEVNRRRYPPEHVRIMRNERLLNTIRLITQSHCPLGCNYCSSTRFLDVVEGRRQTVLMQDPEETVSTMERALAAHPETTSFYLNDDDFVLRRPRALEFARLVVKRFGAGRLSFICMTRVDHVDEEMARELAGAGFRLIFLGVETFSAGTLAAMEKHLHHRGDYTSLARQAVLTLLEAGIVPQIGLIPFYPAVHEEDLLVTIENAVDLVGRGARLSIFPMTDAYPGASLFKSSYRVSTQEIRVGRQKLCLPVHFLPEDPAMQDLAARAIDEHRRLRTVRRADVMPQPADGLYFLRSILSQLGRNTAEVDRVLGELESQHGGLPRSPLQYMNA